MPYSQMHRLNVTSITIKINRKSKKFISAENALHRQKEGIKYSLQSNQYQKMKEVVVTVLDIHKDYHWLNRTLITIKIEKN